MGRGMTKGQMRQKYGDDVYWKPRDRKHRYVLFHGSKKERKAMANDLRYGIKPYPKGQNIRYDASHNPQTQAILL
jgi:hypothetical protein